MTPADICRNALIQGGIVTLPETVYAEDILKAFGQLNSMIAQWNHVRFNIYNLIDVSVVSNGSESYSIGPVVGDIITPRPDKILAAYSRQMPVVGNQPIDVQMQVIEAREDYSAIMLKSLQGYPAMVFLDTNYPDARLYVYPIPQAGQYEIHIVIKSQLIGFDTLSDLIAMPDVYIDAMTWNLAVRLRPVYKMPPDPTVQAMALQSMSVVQGANSQVGILRMPIGFGPGRTGNGAYWYYTGGGA